MEKPLHIFCCYARLDQSYLIELRNRLIPLQRAGLIIVHADIDISPGEDWEPKIHHYLNTAHVILLLVSPDFIASEYCYSKEMMRALERHNEGDAYVIPIILRPVDLRRVPFSKIQSLPTDAKPVTKWETEDDAFLDVVNGIEEVMEKLLSQSQAPTQPQKTKEQWFDEGKLHYQSKHYEEALVAFDQAILLNPQDAPSYHYKSRTLDNLGRNEEALEALEQAIFLDPANAESYASKEAEQARLVEEEQRYKAEKERLAALPEKNAPRPGLHSPDPSEGNVADVPFFPNPRAKEAERTRRVAEDPVPSQSPLDKEMPPDQSFRQKLGDARQLPLQTPVRTTPYTYHGHSKSVQTVAWSPDGKRIASGSDDKTVQVWDAADGGHGFTYRGHSQKVQTVAWSPDGKRIASGSDDKTVQVWDAADGGHGFTYSGHSSFVYSVAWSPDGKRIASGVKKSVEVWDAADGGHSFTYSGHSKSVQIVAWSPDGKRIASGSGDKTVQVWDAVDGGHVFTYRGHKGGWLSMVTSVAWAPDGKRIASGGAAVQVWDVADGGHGFTYSGRSSFVYSVAWSPDGKRIASGGADKAVRVWDAANPLMVTSEGGKISIVHLNREETGFSAILPTSTPIKEAFTIILDDKEIGRIGRGQSRTFEVEPGPHTIFLRIGTTSSPDLTFHIALGETLVFLGHGKYTLFGDYIRLMRSYETFR